MEIDSIKKVHIIGIGGIGVSAIARLFLNLGKKVSGSDLADSSLLVTLKGLGAKISIGHSAENLDADADLVVYSDAIPEDNAERVKAKEKEITSMSYFQFLGEFSKEKDTIAISGAHGKTTTTALTGAIFEKATLDPTIIVGTKIKQWDDNYRHGSSDLFIVEADEYRRHLLELSPQSIILTNIDADHLDYYKDLSEIIDVMTEFVYKLPSDGTLILNIDDPIIKSRLDRPPCNVLTHSIDSDSADLVAKAVKVENGRQIFRLVYKGRDLRDFNLKIPGKFNISNALGAILLALEKGVDPKLIKDVLSTYEGSWRRFERVGRIKPMESGKEGALVISDYAHHPAEIKSTIEAARSFYPDNNIIVAFQPHQIDRTKRFMNEYIQVFAEANVETVIISEIFQVAGREGKDDGVSSHQIVEALTSAETKEMAKGKKSTRNYYFQKTLEDTRNEILRNLKDDDVVLVMGAGDIDEVARELIEV